MRHARVAEDFVEASCVERVPVMDEKSLSSQEATQVVDRVPGYWLRFGYFIGDGSGSRAPCHLEVRTRAMHQRPAS